MTQTTVAEIVEIFENSIRVPMGHLFKKLPTGDWEEELHTFQNRLAFAVAEAVHEGVRRGVKPFDPTTDV